MKIKFIIFLLALAMQATSYANTNSVSTPENNDFQSKCIEISLVPAATLSDLLTPILNNLDEEVECTVTLKVKFGILGNGVEGTITVKGDCDEIMEIAIAKYKELKAAIE